MSAQLTVLERLRAYAAAHPSDVAVIAEGVRQDAESEAYRALAELARKWRRRNSGTRLTRAMARAAVNAALDEEVSRGFAGAMYEHLQRDLRAEQTATRAEAVALGECLEAGREPPRYLPSPHGAWRPSTDTVVGMPRPVLDEEPFPLNRVKRLPLPPKRAAVRPGWLDLVRAVQRAHRRRCKKSTPRRFSDAAE